MECVFQTLIDLDDIFNAKENKTRLFDNESSFSNFSRGLATSQILTEKNKPVETEDLPWTLLKKLNSCLPLTARFKICENTVRETVIIYYEHLLQRLLNSVQRDTFDEKWKYEVYEGIFTNGCHDQAIVTLCKALQITGQSEKQNVIVLILKKFVIGGSFAELMFHECYFNNSPLSSTNQRSIRKKIPNPHWDQVLSYLVHLPDKMANKVKGKPEFPFDKSSYVVLFSEALLVALGQLSEEFPRGKKFSLDFMSQLLGRMCLIGYGEEIFKIITPKILRQCKTNSDWRHVTRLVIVGVPDRCLDNVIKPLLSNIPWYGYVKYFFGEHILKKDTLYFLLTRKFVLVRFFEDQTILKNIIGYLARDVISENHNVFLELIRHIFESWADRTSLHYLSYEQHFNWTCTICMAYGYLKSMNFEAYKPDYLSLVMEGVQLHIKNSSERVRVQGMVVGQLYTALLQPDMPQLKFEFEETPDVIKLMAFTLPPPEPDEITSEAATNGHAVAVQSPTDIAQLSSMQLNKNKKTLDSQGDIDSDDDLEAFDLSNDVEAPDSKTPYYIRDCMKGLIDQSDPLWSRSCLDCAHKLIASQPKETKEIAEELCKILLSLDDNMGHEDFIPLRFKALVAVVVNSPETVSKYLATQFYDRNYNMRQRYDVLAVLAAASQELSGIRNVSSKPLQRREVLYRNIHEVEPPTWQEIVRRRVEAKTKIISKGKSAEPISFENQFSKVAGCFFFPLVSNYDNKPNSIDLVGEDSHLLGRLIYTFGIFINSASNSMIVTKMSKTLLEFLWLFRYHVEVFVRQSLLFALAMILLNVPPQILYSELETDIFEFKSWLEDVIQRDVDNECQRVGVQVLSLLVKTYTEVHQEVLDLRY